MAADLVLDRMRTLADFCSEPSTPINARFIVLDRIHNPQNLGMIVRSVAAGGINALFIPQQGNATISPLVIKASAGALFKCPIVRCETTEECIHALRERNICISVLSSQSKTSLLQEHGRQQPVAFVLGNESEGVSQAVSALADEQLKIPMHNEIESLNVAVTAALIAFLPKQ